MKKILGAGVVVAAVALSSASAWALPMSFSITGLGAYTVNTGDITALTTTKTLPNIELVGNTNGSAAVAGVLVAGTVTFSTLTLNTSNGAFVFTVSAGTQVYTFTSIVNTVITPTGANSNGTISEAFLGTVTTDPTGFFLGQTASLSESCTQTQIGSVVNCSDTLATPSNVQTPEPASLALFGAGLAGLGVFRRRRNKAAA